MSNKRTPTPVQRRILTAAAAHKIGRVIKGNPRTTEVLIAQGWIAVDGFLYGPLFKITDEGRKAIGLLDNSNSIATVLS